MSGFDREIIDRHIRAWAARLSKKQPSLGNHAVCPWAISADYEIQNYDLGEYDPPDREIDLIILVVDDQVTEQQLNDAGKKLNQQHQDYIFLTDFRNKNTFINDVQTNNGKFNFILCQPKDKLNKARISLSKTNYYSYWDQDYLTEILGDNKDILC